MREQTFLQKKLPENQFYTIFFEKNEEKCIFSLFFHAKNLNFFNKVLIYTWLDFQIHLINLKTIKEAHHGCT